MNPVHLFISHSWKYHSQYSGLENLLDQAPYFSYHNYSVPKDDPVHTNGTNAQLTEKILNQMRPTQIVLVLAGGVYASYSKWIKIELEEAKRMGKPILAIKPHGNTNISQQVRDYADQIVSWNTSSIVAAIRKLRK